jgi:hypothetical protein
MEPYNIKLESENMQSAEGIMSDAVSKILTSPSLIDEPAMHTIVNKTLIRFEI